MSLVARQRFPWGQESIRVGYRHIKDGPGQKEGGSSATLPPTSVSELEKEIYANKDPKGGCRFAVQLTGPLFAGQK